MSRLMVGAGALILLTGGAAIVVQHLDNAALRREFSLLRMEVKALALAAKSNAISAQRSHDPNVNAESATAVMVREDDNQDLAKLRAEVGALRQSTQEITRLAQAASVAKALEKSAESVPTNLIPAAALKNSGKATPEASTQTALWAAVSGDVDALAGTLVFTASARAKADDWFAGMTPGAQQQYGSPEKVIALMIAKDAEALSGMQVLGQKEISPDNVGVRVRIAGADGKSKDDTLLMHRSADGWKMVLPDATVEKYARQLARGR